MSATELPEFEHPPVVEVVCGITFHDLNNMLAAHLGGLWDRYRADYPTCREVPPLSAVIESLETPASVDFAFLDVPPMARTWFVHRDETGIIQVQRDRFLHNWKKVRPSDEYPRYQKVIRLFRDRLATFESFLSDNGIGALQHRQFELTYVNHIPRGDAWGGLSDVGGVLADFSRSTSASRFLPEPDGIDWRTSFLLPNGAGRLHATIRNATRPDDRTDVLQLELTARGLPPVRDETALWQWFELAHEWIVRGFADLTTERVRKDSWRQIR